MGDGYFLQLARDCLGQALMDKYVKDWRNMNEEELIAWQATLDNYKRSQIKE